jgi:RND family efflux transporter MFP subunit
MPALLLPVVGCTTEAADPEQTPPPVIRATRVETLVVEPTSFDESIEVTGVVEALNDATLAAQVSGRVDRIADRGDRVASGAVVARLDQAFALAAVEQAEAQVQTAEAERALAIDNRDRLQPLVDRQIISAREFAQARLQLEQAEANLRQAAAAVANARVQLRNTTVRAPFAGIVEESLLEPGEHAGSGDPVVRLVATERMKVVAGVSERYVSDLRAGMDVIVSFPTAGLSSRAGTVTFVGGAIEMLSRTFPIEVQTPNPDGDLKPMMLAEVRVVRVRHQDALTLPRSAVVNDELGDGVYVVEREVAGVVARWRPVTVGADAVGFVIVTNGLEPGDEVVVRGQHGLSDGDPLEVGSDPSDSGASGLGAAR